jgi:hypothetical protein
MPRLNRALLAVAFCAMATLARGDSLRLLAPANGATLRGGSQAELHWDAARLPEDAEEWEAFLSVDGGRYYGFRVTPHLDIELRRFTFLVPNFETRDARILIRTGDEEEETEFESGVSFSIVRDPHAETVLPQIPDFERGEAAREGDPAVLSWTDGERNGSGITQRSSTTVPAPALAGHTLVTREEWAEVAPPGNRVASLSTIDTLLPARAKLAHHAESLPLPFDLLLVCRRRNI